MLIAIIAAATAAAPPRVHTVFCAECSNNFDYKSLGVYWSHALSGMQGNVTRLLACDENELLRYKGLNLGPTFVHKNHGRVNHMRDNKGEPPPFGSRQSDASPSYNKPGSIMHWVMESEEAKHVDYVLYIDADMLLRLPMDPIKMGVKPGVVVSEHVGYLDTGLRSGLPFQFLPDDAAHMAGDDVNDHHPAGPNGKKHAAGGWYHFFHIDDIRKIAHRWYYWEREFRLNPQLYWRMIDPKTGKPGGADHDIATGDAYVSHGTAPWISEMYGYVFAAAEAGLRHILTHGVVVYPDEIGAGQPQEPSIIHYGLHCTVGSFHFTKYTHGMFDAVGCTGHLFGDPPLPSHLERLCAETVLTLNDAMCDYYQRPVSEGGCGFPQLGKPPPQCPKWKTPKARTCADKESECSTWANSGECTKNPGFMLGSCPKSCDQCGGAAMAKVPSWGRGLAIAHGEEPAPMRKLSLPRSELSSDVAGAHMHTGSAGVLHRLSGSNGDGGSSSGGAARAMTDHADHADSGDAVGAAAAAAARKARHARLVGAAAAAADEERQGRFRSATGAPRRALNSSKATTIGQLRRLRQQAAADDTATKAGIDDSGAAREAVGEVEPARAVADGGRASLATLRWQMYVGWVAILGLCGLMVGRRLCRGSKRQHAQRPKRGV